MHTPRILSLALAAWISSDAAAQVLNGTTWQVTCTGGGVVYMQFSADSMAGSIDQVNYTTYSTYAEAGALCEIVDVPGGGGCPATDTGRYTFQIQYDTLYWTLVSDPCVFRTPVFTTCIWSDLATVIPEPGADLPHLFPVPARSALRLTAAPPALTGAYSILDRSGRVVDSGQLHAASDLIPVALLTPGVYLFRMDADPSVTLRFVKE